MAVSIRDYWGHILVFVEVAKEKSFKSASENLNISPPAISKHISSLESKLEIKLFERDTRNVDLTKEGRDFFKCCEQGVELIDGAKLDLFENSEDPSGEIRILAPVSLGEEHISKFISGFSKKYKNIQFEVNFSNRSVSLLKEGFNFVIGEQSFLNENQGILCKNLISSKRRLFASSEYIDKFGEPKNPKELKNHQMLEYSPGKAKNIWFYRNKKNTGSVKYISCLTSNNKQMLLQAVREGLGILSIDEKILEEEINKKKLVPVLPSFMEEPALNYYIFYHENEKYLSASKVFLIELEKYFEVLRNS